MEEKELRENIVKELFEIWREAKESTGESWDDVTFESLPKKHKQEYYLTVERIIKYHEQAGYRKVTGELPVLTECL